LRSLCSGNFSRCGSDLLPHGAASVRFQAGQPDPDARWKFSIPRLEKFGWGGRIRTYTIRINSAVSYRLDHAPADSKRPVESIPGPSSTFALNVRSWPRRRPRLKEDKRSPRNAQVNSQNNIIPASRWESVLRIGKRLRPDQYCQAKKIVRMKDQRIRALKKSRPGEPGNSIA
jgi:hypothetical protein